MRWSDGLVGAGLAGAGYWMVSRALSPKERSALDSEVVGGIIVTAKEHLLDRWLDLATRCIADAMNPRYSDDDEFVIRCLDRAHKSLDQACAMLDRGRDQRLAPSERSQS